MTETVGVDPPPVAKPVSRQRSAKPATVSASALALHLMTGRTASRDGAGDGAVVHVE
jgi:hypothetical protein